MNTDVLEQYASLKSIISDCEKKLKVIKPEVDEIVLSQGGAEVSIGTFTITRKPVYEYTQETMEMEVNLKAKKKQEEMEGVAKIISTNEVVNFNKAK